MGLSEFHDILSTIILHLGDDPGDGQRRNDISMICRRHRPFSYFTFDNCLYLRSRKPCYGSQFPESHGAFSGCGKQFHEIAMTEIGRG
jgi:hypothetical protein